MNWELRGNHLKILGINESQSHPFCSFFFFYKYENKIDSTGNITRATGQGQCVHLKHDIFCDSTVTHWMDSFLAIQIFFFSVWLYRWPEWTKGLPGLKSMWDTSWHDMSSEMLKEQHVNIYWADRTSFQDSQLSVQCFNYWETRMWRNWA